MLVLFMIFFICVCLSNTNYEISRDNWRFLSCMKALRFLLVAQGGDGGSKDTEETAVVHKGMWGRGLWESTLFLRFPLFSPWLCSTGPQAQPPSVHGLFLILWPASIPAILSLPIRYLLPGFLIQTTGQRRKGERKRKRNGVILPWCLNTGQRRGGRSVSTERKREGKRRQRSHGSSVTGGRSRECQATLPALLQPLLHPIPVPVPLHVQKQQSLRETHTQTRLFSITLSSWAGYIEVPLLAATSFSGVQHCRVWVVAVWKPFGSAAPPAKQRTAIQRSGPCTCRGAWIWAVACLLGKSLHSSVSCLSFHLPSLFRLLSSESGTACWHSHLGSGWETIGKKKHYPAWIKYIHSK